MASLFLQAREHGKVENVGVGSRGALLLHCAEDVASARSRVLCLEVMVGRRF